MIGYRKETLIVSFFPVKFILDSAVLALSITVIVNPISTTNPGDNSTEPPEKVYNGMFGLRRCNGDSISCERDFQFRWFVLGLSAAFLSVELVRTVELAWSIRKAVVDWTRAKRGREKTFVYYYKGSMRLPHSAYSLMIGESNKVRFYWYRLIIAVPNSFYFLLLPIVSLVWKRSIPTSREVLQWFWFSPSILLAYSLFPLLVVLVREGESFLDHFFAVVSLQIFGKLSSNVLDTIFQRSVAGGKSMLPFTEHGPEAASDTYYANNISYLLGYKKESAIYVDRNKLPYNMLQMLTMLTETIHCYGRPANINFAFPNYRIHEDPEHQTEEERLAEQEGVREQYDALANALQKLAAEDSARKGRTVNATMRFEDYASSLEERPEHERWRHPAIEHPNVDATFGIVGGPELPDRSRGWCGCCSNTPRPSPGVAYEAARRSQRRFPRG